MKSLQTEIPYFNNQSDGEQISHGLGLMIVRKIVAVHGGELKLSGEEGEYFRADIVFAGDIGV